MPFVTITSGLTLTVPTNGTRNWGTTLKSLSWDKISAHDHTGSPNGQQITTAALATNVVPFKEAATLTPAGTTETINFNLGSSQTLDLSSATGSVTVTLSNPTDAGRYRILIVQGGTARVVVWPAAVLWPQSEEATQYMEANTTGIIYLDYDGTNYYGSWDVDFS